MKILPTLHTKRTDDKTSRKFKKFKDHEEMANRLTKTLYYGKNPQTDRPSLAMTDIAVELFSNAVPNVGLDQIDMHYAATVSRNACASPCSLMLALVYIDRLRRTNPDYLKTVSSSDIFLVSMMIASKFLYDEGEEEEVFNEEWAASANMDTKDINQIEREFLAALDWNLFVDTITLYQLLHQLESHIALKEGLKRGWFSYTDLEILSQNLPGLESLHLFLENVFKVAFACAVTYTASVLIMAGSTILVHRGLCLDKWLLNPISIEVKSPLVEQNNFNNESINAALQFDMFEIEHSINCALCSTNKNHWDIDNFHSASKNSGLYETTSNLSSSSIVVDIGKNRLTFETSSILPSIQECLCKNQLFQLQNPVVESACSKPMPISVLSR